MPSFATQILAEKNHSRKGMIDPRFARSRKRKHNFMTEAKARSTGVGAHFIPIPLARDHADRIRNATRFEINDEVLSATVRYMAQGAERLEANIDHLHLPASRLWAEFSETFRCQEYASTGGPLKPLTEHRYVPDRFGVLIECDDASMQSGSVDWFWSGKTAGEPSCVSGVGMRFDFLHPASKQECRRYWPEATLAGPHGNLYAYVRWGLTPATVPIIEASSRRNPDVSDILTALFYYVVDEWPFLVALLQVQAAKQTTERAAATKTDRQNGTPERCGGCENFTRSLVTMRLTGDGQDMQPAAIEPEALMAGDQPEIPQPVDEPEIEVFTVENEARHRQSPRGHLVIGHWRRRQNGRMSWIPQHVRGRIRHGMTPTGNTYVVVP